VKETTVERKKRESNEAKLLEQQRLEKARHDELIGQLKAAEARNRSKLLQQRREKLKRDELDYLISSQPTAAAAVRLEALMPPNQETDQPRSRRESEIEKIDKVTRTNRAVNE